MGIYLGVFNLTKKEWFTGHDLDQGAKWDETLHGAPAAALCYLLFNPNRILWADKSDWQGRWCGDHIVLLDDSGITWAEAVQPFDAEVHAAGAVSDDQLAACGWVNIGDHLLGVMRANGDLEVPQ